MLGILAFLCAIGSLVCLIIVLLKLFEEKGALHGVLGFFCGLYTFIWGWISASRLGIRNIMLIWTLLLILYTVLSLLGGGFHYSFGTR